MHEYIPVSGDSEPAPRNPSGDLRKFMSSGDPAIVLGDVSGVVPVESRIDRLCPDEPRPGDTIGLGLGAEQASNFLSML